MRSHLVLIVSGLLTVAACGDDGGGTRSSEPPVQDRSAGPRDSSSSPVIDPGDGGDYRPDVDRARFVETIDNRYLPLAVGSRWVYEGRSDGEVERVEVVVTDQRRDVFGITATVVRDTVHIGGVLVEDTLDWFAQDADGNVWYLGEAVENYEDGVLADRDGSWEAGVDGALPGIVMPAEPTAGHAYRQEFWPGEAEDLGEILATDRQVTVAAGDFDAVVTTRDWNPLDPAAVEEKDYAPDVGLIRERTVAGGDGVTELVEFTPG